MIYFVNPTSHPNIGDIAIFYATLKFFKDNKFEYKIVNKNNYRQYNVTDDDIIAVLGGGWIGIYQCDITDFYFKFIDEHRNSHIIFLPSSFFPVTNSYKKISDINALIFARDQLSLKNYRNEFPNAKVFYCADMVFTLNRIYNTESYIKKGYGLYTRDDTETDKNSEQKILSFTNESSGKESRFYKSWLKFDDNIELYEDIVYKFLFNMLKYKYIITDSLHMSIFSYLINRPCIILDNKYKKLTNTWAQYKKSCVKQFEYEKSICNYDFDFSDIPFSFDLLKHSFKKFLSK